MNWFSTLSVRTKLIAGFLAVSVIAGVIGIVGLISFSQITTNSSQMYQEDVVGLREAAEANAHILAAETELRIILATSDAEQTKHVTAMNENFTAANRHLNNLKELFTTDAGQAAVTEAQESLYEYRVQTNKVLNALQSHSINASSDAQTLMEAKAVPVANKTEELMRSLILEAQDNAKDLNDHINEIANTANLVMMVLTAMGAFIAMLLGWLLTRNIMSQLGGEPSDAARVVNAIARGDLTEPIDIRRAAKGSVMHATGEMQSALRRIVTAVRQSSDSIATGSSEISFGNADLSQRTEEQAANLTQTAAAMEEISSTVNSNADVAQQAANLAQNASAAAIKGGEVVDEVVQKMNEISGSSDKIVEIIAVIDSIAFQTNILALNAAVEAARAGEQGRGFAVVASEVRSLAQKSAAAARDIKQLIDENVSRTHVGSQMVDAAGNAMAEIVEQVKEASALISEISAATREQTVGIAQVNDAVLQLSDVTQQNAALVEESAAASDSLSNQAKTLVDVVNVFRLSGADSAIERAVGSASQQPKLTKEIEAAHPRIVSPKLLSGSGQQPQRTSVASADDWEEF